MWVPEKAIHRVPVLLFLVDVCLVGLVFFFAYDYRFSGPFLDPQAAEHSADHRLLGIAAIVFWPPALHLLNLYNPSRFRLGLKLLMRIAQAGLIAAILTATVIFALNATQVSRIVFGILFVGSGVALWAVRVALSALLMQVTAGLRVVVIGTGPVAKRFVDIMTEQGEADSSVLGHFDIGEPDTSVDDDTIIGPIDQLTPHVGARRGRPGCTGRPGRRRQSPTSGSHRTPHADFPHGALQRLIHNTAHRWSSP